MSLQLSIADVVFQQRFLKAQGFYDGSLDGKWGPMTDDAMSKFVTASKAVAAKYPAADSRSESIISGLHVSAQDRFRQFLKDCSECQELINEQLSVRLISGMRTVPEQDRLYAQGRTTSGKIVTNAKGGQSFHNYGVAVDIGVFSKTGAYLQDEKMYQLVAKHCGRNLEWGGSWASIKDWPHYQLPGLALADVASKFMAGLKYV